MAEWSKALRSGRSPLLRAWVRIPLLTRSIFSAFPSQKSVSFLRASGTFIITVIFVLKKDKYFFKAIKPLTWLPRTRQKRGMSYVYGSLTRQVEKIGSYKRDLDPASRPALFQGQCRDIYTYTHACMHPWPIMEYYVCLSICLSQILS